MLISWESLVKVANLPVVPSAVEKEAVVPKSPPDKLRTAKLEVPVVLKPPAVMLLMAVIDLEILREPLKELEPAPVDRNWAAVVILALAPEVWMPKVVLREPLKEEEVVVALREKMLEMEATT